MYALTRNTQSPAAQGLRNRGANVVKGDLDDSDSLERAVKDVDCIFLMRIYQKKQQEVSKPVHCPLYKSILFQNLSDGHLAVGLIMFYNIIPSAIGEILKEK